MARQGAALLKLGPRAVLMKGGHLEGEEAVDLLVTEDAFVVSPRRDSPREICTAPAARCRAPSPPTSCSGCPCRRLWRRPRRSCAESIERGRHITLGAERAADPDRAAFETLPHPIRTRVVWRLPARRIGRHGRRLLRDHSRVRQFRRRGKTSRTIGRCRTTGWSASPTSIGSTKAIAEGRYKAVNMVGAGVIAAVANALGRRPFAFVFGGDGASFAVVVVRCARRRQGAAGDGGVRARGIADGVARRDGSGRGVRAAGRDVRVARFAASPHCAYAMFAGGGLTWVEAEAKRGAYALAPAAPGARPDLSDLSCRWTIAPANARDCSIGDRDAARATIPALPLSSRTSSPWRLARERRPADHAGEPGRRMARRGDFAGDRRHGEAGRLAPQDQARVDGEIFARASLSTNSN